MNPVQVVEAARPEIGTIPAAARRHLREQIFDVAMRSQSEFAPVPVSSPNNRLSNALRVAALIGLGAVAIGGLAYTASRDTPTEFDTATPSSDPSLPTSAPSRNTIVPATPPTTTPPTTEPPESGSAETPLLLPPERNRLDVLTVTRSKLGASALLLRAPDLSTISLSEVDGVAPIEPEIVEDEPDDDEPPPTTVPPRDFAAVSVLVPDEASPGQYELVVPCGSATVLDSSGRPDFRPQIVELFDSMRIVDGVIALALPEGWTPISAGPGTDEFTFGLPVDIDGQQVTIEVAQYPGGSLAVAGYDQRQYAPATFNGQPAWLHRDADDPAAFDVITLVGTTAIRVSTRDITLAQVEAVVNRLTPGDVDEWTNRFGTLPVEQDPDIRACADQPSYRLD